MRLVTRYIWSELIPSCAEGIALLTLIFLLKQMFDILPRLLDTGAQFGSLAGLLIAMIPPVGLLTLPMAVLLGTLLTYGRLAEENEITAMEVGGLTLLEIYRPAVVFGLMVTVFLLVWSHVVVPKSLRVTYQTMVEVLQKTSTGGLMPGRFMRLGSLTIVCERIQPETRRLIGTMVFENSPEGIAAVVAAPTAQLQMFPERGELVLDLEDVYLHRIRLSGEEESAEQSDQIVRAAHMSWTTDVRGLVLRLVSKATRGSKLTPTELNQAIKKASRVGQRELDLLNGWRNREIETIEAADWPQERKRKEINRLNKEYESRLGGIQDVLIRPRELRLQRAFRVSLPFAAVLMVMVGAPLGVLMRRGRRAAAFAVTIAVVLLYYVLLSMGKAFAVDGLLPVTLGVWLPNIAAAAVAFVVYRKTAYP